MKHSFKGRAAACVLTVAMLPLVAPLAAQPQETADIYARNNQTGQLAGQGRYGPAITLLKHFLEARERTLGQEHPFTLKTIDSLALLYKAQGNYSEAEPLYKRALDASERTLGKEHPFTLATAKSLASLYEAEGRYREAELLYRPALAAQDRTPSN